MNRRKFLKTAGLGAAALAMSGCLPELSRADLKHKKPNFLFIFSDDQTYKSIHALNNPQIKTPNLDRLCARSTVFTHSFNQGAWNGAICVASRAMLNTGQTLFHAKSAIDIASTPLWGQTFTEAGYNTFMTGKWHNGKDTLFRSFTTVGPYGGGMFGSTKAAYNRPAEGNEWSPSDKTLKGHWRKTEDGIEHSSKIWTDAAIDYLTEKACSDDKPFFMYVAFHAPHDPRQSPEKYVDMYPPEKMELPPNYMPEHPFDQGDHDIRDEELAPFPRSEHAVQVHLAEYYAIITHFDDQLGRLLDALESSGQADNTYIIFSSDHGLAVGQHGLMGKQNQYDHSVRMPLFVSGPGIEKGKKIDAMVYLQSVFATSCELAGISTPGTVEFPSLVPLIEGKKSKLYDAVFGSYRDLQRMVRTKDYKLIIYPHNGEVQLFDIKNDPWETKDLAEEPSYKDKVNELLDILKEQLRQHDDDLEIDYSRYKN